jgi:hypothetical protein
VITSQDKATAFKKDNVQPSYFDIEFSDNGESTREDQDTQRYQQLRNLSVIAGENNTSLRILREALLLSRHTN